MSEHEARGTGVSSGDEIFDVAVVGGGPAGLSAALWAGRYRRRVLLIDGGKPRNRWTSATHGYLGFDGMPPAAILEKARADVARYPEILIEREAEVEAVTVTEPEGFDLELGSRGPIRALRLVLATGVRDEFPEIDDIEQFVGTSVFTCPTCDGYEAREKHVAIVGELAAEDLAAFATGLLDWAESVTMIHSDAGEGRSNRYAEFAGPRLRFARGQAAALEGRDGRVRAVRLADGSAVDCEVVFCTAGHVQHSDLPVKLGCEISADGCVVVDDQCRTSVEHVFAAGDMTPGPHLVQVAAAKGAIAGVAAAVSLRGQRGSPRSPRPAPDAEKITASQTG